MYSRSFRTANAYIVEHSRTAYHIGIESEPGRLVKGHSHIGYLACMLHIYFPHQGIVS